MNKLVWMKVGKTLTDWRLLGTLFVAAVAVALLVSLDASDTAQRAAEDTRRLTTAQNRATMVTEHNQCLRVNDVRRRIRAYSEETVRLTYVAVLPGQPPFTAAERAAIDKLAEDIRAAGTSILPKTNCDKVSPLPPNLTDAEKARLSKPEPIVIPG